MPDHLHALLSFPPSPSAMRDTIRKWKEWTAKEIGIEWQRSFFERRLRSDESLREKSDYVLQNPVRKNLVARPEEWPFIYFGDREGGRDGPLGRPFYSQSNPTPGGQFPVSDFVRVISACPD